MSSDIKKTIIPYSELLQSRMENSYFNDVLNNTYKDYSEEYKVLPEVEQVNAKFDTKLKTFFEYKFEAEAGSLFNIFFSPIIFTPFFSIISSAFVNAVLPPCTAAKS